MQKFKIFDRNTRRPDPLPPQKSCDSQFHVFGPVEKYPIRPGAVYHTPEATMAEARRMHKAIGFERGVIVQNTAYATNSRPLLDALAEAGPNYRGCAVIDETVGDAELERLKAAGVGGARFNFNKRLNLVPSEQSLRHAVARMEKLGWYAKINATANDIVEREALLKTLKLHVVIDHLGGLPGPDAGVRQEARRVVKDLLQRGNWWVMLSNGDRRSQTGYPFDDAVAVARDFIAWAPERMIWGSDWPHPLVTEDMEMKNDGDLVALLYRYAPSDADRRRILVDNPATLFGFED